MLYPYITEGNFIWMVPIIFFSVCAFAILFERSFYWAVEGLNSRGRKKKLRKFFAEPFERETAQEMCRKTKDKVFSTLGKFLHEYENVALIIAERRAHAEAEVLVQDSRKFLDFLSLIASVSGTLGLLGTVVGIALGIHEMGSGEHKGLALSMYTTIGGIILFLISYTTMFCFGKFSDFFEDSLASNMDKLKNLLEIEEKSKIVFEGKEQEKSLEHNKQLSQTISEQGAQEKVRFLEPPKTGENIKKMEPEAKFQEGVKDDELEITQQASNLLQKKA